MDPVQLLSTVNSFYDQAFNKLMIVTFGVLAFIGVLVPLVVGWVQMRTLRTEKHSILRDLKSEIETEREAIRQAIEGSVRDEMSQVRADLEMRIEELSSELKTSSAAAEARSFHLQGLSFTKSESQFLANTDFAHAARLYIDAKDESNAQRCITSIINDCLPKTNCENYKRYKISDSCEKLLAKLRECNENGRYSNSITKLENEMESASTREVPKKSEVGA